MRWRRDGDTVYLSFDEFTDAITRPFTLPTDAGRLRYPDAIDVDSHDTTEGAPQ